MTDRPSDRLDYLSSSSRPYDAKRIVRQRPASLLAARINDMAWVERSKTVSYNRDPSCAWR